MASRKPAQDSAKAKGLDSLLASFGRSVHKKEDPYVNDLIAQSERLSAERNAALAAPQLAPDKINGKVLRYHYQDVSIWVVWQFSGHYGKSCESAGIRRGDRVDLIPHPIDEDNEAVDVLWHGECIGHMRTSRLRNMVVQWRETNMPTYYAVSQVGGENKILLELAFYGFPTSKK